MSATHLIGQPSEMRASFSSKVREFVNTSRDGCYWDLASAALFFVVGILILSTFTQYGITWDEPIQNRYGAEIVRYYRLLLHGKYVLPLDSMPESNLYLYGGLFDTLAAPFNFFRHGLYEGRHLLNALIGLLGIVGCWKVARFVGGPSVGFLSALLLAITPRYYGPMFNNPKDIPFAVGYVWSVYYLLQFAKNLPRVSARLNVKLGLALGATLATRIGGLVLLGYLGLIVLGYFAFGIATGKLKLSVASAKLFAKVAFSCVWLTGIAWAVMLLFWPWAQARPFTRPLQAMSRFSYFADWQGKVLYAGSLINSTAIPRTYILRWLFITMPEIFLAGLAISLIYGFLWVFRTRSEGWESGVRNATVLLLASVFPIAYVMAHRSILYNGERHLIFVLPCLACLAAWGTHRAVTMLNATPRRVVAICGIAYLGFHLAILVRLHPNEYVYFNRIVGGLPGASGRYDTDYWGNSYREAVLDLSRALPKSSSDTTKYKIYLKYIDKACVTYYFPPNFALALDPSEADYFIANTSIGMDKTVDGTIVLSVERLGVPLAVVKELPAAREHGVGLVSSSNAGHTRTESSWKAF